jgi:hypothetical protein
MFKPYISQWQFMINLRGQQRNKNQIHAVFWHTFKLCYLCKAEDTILSYAYVEKEYHQTKHCCYIDRSPVVFYKHVINSVIY